MTGIIICCSAAGSMILPYLVNYLFPLLGPESLLYLVLASLFCAAVIFVIMLFAFRRKANPGDPPQKWYYFFLKNKRVNEEKKLEKPEFVSLKQITQPEKIVAQV
jgi:Na+/melibiose symporter-like transporter